MLRKLRTEHHRFLCRMRSRILKRSEKIYQKSTHPNHFLLFWWKPWESFFRWIGWSLFYLPFLFLERFWDWPNIKIEEEKMLKVSVGWFLVLPDSSLGRWLLRNYQEGDQPFYPIEEEKKWMRNKRKVRGVRFLLLSGWGQVQWHGVGHSHLSLIGITII